MNIFVIMPFEDTFFQTFDEIKEYLGDSYNLAHASEVDNQQNILADVIRPIYEADIILADLTGLNPNVMYELGIAHSFNKKTIMISRDDVNCLPFDIDHYRVKSYNTSYKDFKGLLEYLKKNIDGAIDGTVKYSNPVKDFLDSESIDLYKSISKGKEEGRENAELGFVDFVAEIEEDTAQFAMNLVKLSESIETMTNGTNECVAEIERVKSNGGQGTASFVRKKANKIASIILTFDGQLKAHNEANTALWKNIETNTLGLLENKFAIKDENKETLVAYLKELLTVKGSCVENISIVKSTKDELLALIGLQKNLTQAIKVLDVNLEFYLTNLGCVISGIDKIISKSRFVVGDIDKI